MAAPTDPAPTVRAPTDRAAAVRSALRTLVAHNGFHGASMSAVAREAGVATGTAYTHYASKDELVLAAYCETKAALGVASTADLDHAAATEVRFHTLWLACYHHLRESPERARFLLQVEHSPYRSAAHEAALADENDPLLAEVALPDFAERILPLPLEVLYELALGPAIRLAAGEVELTQTQLGDIADACWRAVSRPG
jgi:AcrR family transcriptional regulator